MTRHTLYLDYPAREWELASPIGNGFSGAMIYGGVKAERVQLTEEKIWAGGKIDTSDETFRDKIEKLRGVLLEDPSKADDFAAELLKDSFYRIKSQETAGEFFITSEDASDECSDYRRELDLFDGISRVSFEKDGERILRESFASYPDRVICMRHTGRHSVRISYSRRRAKSVINWAERKAGIEEGEAEFGVESVSVAGNMMTILAHPSEGGERFTVKLKIFTDGKLTDDGRDFLISGATKTDYFIVIATGGEPEFPVCDYDVLKARSVADVNSLMSRAGLDLGDELAELPANKRLERLRSDDNATDPGLAALYFDFGRYLLVSSSRPGSLPANLQGVWNAYTSALWNSDYHTNINLQMNYWHAETTNLSECTKPLFDYMNDYLLESGRETARVNYKCGGTVLHHLSDIYGFTAAADGVWGLWPMGGAWLCYSMWEHYLFTRDLEFLRDTAYDYIHDSARFFLDYMFEKDGVLMTGPSTSPENHYFCNGKSVNLCLSPTMDIEIIGGLLRFYIETEKLLSLDADQATEAENALSKLPPLKIGKHGQLMEWQEDYDEPEPGHRHVSHLFALYPDAAINKDTPELFVAAKRSLERRLANGGGHTGWSCAWLIALFARLGDADGAKSTIRKLLTKSTRENLFDSHPPFQIDGNFGATAAIAEMLVQSQGSRIELLPAFPADWDGSFSGLMIRGGAEISAAWKGGKVTSCVIKAVRADVEFVLSVNDGEIPVRLGRGESFIYG